MPMYKIVPEGGSVMTDGHTLDVILEERGVLATSPNGELVELEGHLDDDDLEALAEAGYHIEKMDMPLTEASDLGYDQTQHPDKRLAWIALKIIAILFCSPLIIFLAWFLFFAK